MSIVETSTGKVQGSVEGPLHVFRGIPYAAAPVGDLRLRAPQPAPPWSGVRAAQAPAPWAPQNPPATTLSGEQPGAQGEDCLGLNVWTPGTDGAKRPVLVWIHGGAFVGGAGSSSLYSGDRLAARGDVVVVTINYRLGILGFLAHPDLADDSAGGAAGNWGLLDQVASLRWVRDNISAFGGDPGNVTIFGESAGGMSVSDLLATPSARGLFRRAIVQSGPPNAIALDRAAETTAKLVAELGAPSPAALREVPTQALLDAQAELMLAQRRSGLPLVPVVDGASIPVAPLQALRDGVAADVDVLIGTNRDEAKMFMVMDPASREPDEGVLHRKIESIFRHNDIALSPHDVIDAYRAARSARGQAVTPRELWSAIDSDRVFRIGSIRAAEAMSSHRRTWMYLFDWESPAMGGALGACHALEIPFVFGTLDTPGIDRFAGAGDDAKALSATMMDAWLAFARAGDPGWTPYDADRRSTQVFGPRVHLTEAPYDAERQVWQTA